MSANSEETDQILKDLGLNPGISFEKVSVVFDVDFVDTSFLEVEVGARLKLEDIQKQPNIKIPDVKDTQYVTMVMLDPDAPSRQSPSAKVIIVFVTYRFHCQIIRILLQQSKNH